MCYSTFGPSRYPECLNQPRALSAVTTPHASSKSTSGVSLFCMRLQWRLIQALTACSSIPRGIREGPQFTCTKTLLDRVEVWRVGGQEKENRA